MLDVRALAYVSPLSEVDFASVALTVRLANLADEPARVSGAFHVYNSSTGLLIHTSTITPVTMTAGQSIDVSALTDFDPPAPADGTYFVIFNGNAANDLVPDGMPVNLGTMYFDVKPVGMGPAPAAHHATHELGGSDEIDCTGLPGAGGSGTDDHAALTNLDYASAGHTGFEATANKGIAGGYCGLPTPLDTTLPMRGDGTVARPIGLFVEAEMLTNTTSSGATLPWTPGAIASGTISNQAGTANHPGTIRKTSSTSANSGYYLLTSTQAILVSGSEKHDIILRPQTLAGTTIRFGLHDSVNQNAPTDGVYMHMDPITGLITGRTMNNTAGTTSGTSFQAVTNTWYRWRIVVNSDASRVDYYVLDEAGTVLWSDFITTNIPTAGGREVGSGVVATNSGTTAVALVDVDYMSLNIARALVR